MNARLFDALDDLVRSLEKAPAHEIRHRVGAWAYENFQIYMVQTSVSEHHIELANDPEDLKSHIVRKAVMEMALGIASECAIGRETPPRITFDLADRYNPSFIANGNHAFYRQLGLEMVSLRRVPERNKGNDTPQQWLKKIVGNK